MLQKLLTNTYNMWSGIVMLKHPTTDVHVQNDVMLQDFISISDARQCCCHMHNSRPTMMDSCPHHDTATTCHMHNSRPTTMMDSCPHHDTATTCHMHNSRPTTMMDSCTHHDTATTCHMHNSRATTMMDSCPHHDTATTKSVDLLDTVWSIMFLSMSIDMCVSISVHSRPSSLDWRKRDSSENETVLLLACVHLALCRHLCDIYTHLLLSYHLSPSSQFIFWAGVTSVLAVLHYLQCLNHCWRVLLWLPMAGSACKVTQLHDARASLSGASFNISVQMLTMATFMRIVHVVLHHHLSLTWLSLRLSLIL